MNLDKNWYLLDDVLEYFSITEKEWRCFILGLGPLKYKAIEQRNEAGLVFVNNSAVENFMLVINRPDSLERSIYDLYIKDHLDDGFDYGVLHEERNKDRYKYHHPYSTKRVFNRLLNNWGIGFPIGITETVFPALSHRDYRGEQVFFNGDDFLSIFGVTCVELIKVIKESPPFDKFKIRTYFSVQGNKTNGIVNFDSRDIFWLMGVCRDKGIRGTDLIYALYNDFDGSLYESYLLRENKPKELLKIERDTLDERQRTHALELQTQIDDIYFEYELNKEEDESAEEQAYLYYVKITDKCLEKSFWKIGVENNQYSRWRKDTTFHIANYIWSVPAARSKVVSVERTIKHNFNTGVHSKIPCFMKNAGYTESLDYDFLDGKKEYVDELLGTPVG